MSRKAISHILKEISDLPEEKRQDALGPYAQLVPLVQSLKLVFDPTIEFALPGPGVPDYKENPYVDCETNLYTEMRRMYLFIKGGNDNLKPLKRETLFMQMLEYIHPDDAKYVVAMKDKQMLFPGITQELVEKTFPGLITPRVVEEVKYVAPAKAGREKDDPLARNNLKLYTCPLGCESLGTGRTHFSKGNFTNYMKKHSWIKEQIGLEAEKQVIALKARAG